ncbi:hypothetical protein [Nocardia sp. NPDC050710]|uniref:hypothetical protein n=1 Tax=Nocardia sp. NPDC050710 TaxID=3157220 RepID=UPI0033FFCC31
MRLRQVRRRELAASASERAGVAARPAEASDEPHDLPGWDRELLARTVALDLGAELALGTGLLLLDVAVESTGWGIGDEGAS